MNGQEHPSVKTELSDATLKIILVFVFVHGLLFGFGLLNDTSLLSGDRSMTRDATIAYVFEVEKISDENSDLNVLLNSDGTSDSRPDIGDRILNSGHAGDYLIQGVILALTNRHVLVMLQLALAFYSTLCFFALLKHSGFSVSSAALSTLFYIVLPGSLLPAHQLSTEAVFVPCTIIACYYFLITCDKKNIDITFIAGLLVLSVAIFVRPQLILFPFCLFIVFVFFSIKKFKTILLTVIPLSLLFTAVWMMVVFSNNGQVSLGGKDHSIGRSFHDTAEQMAMSGDFEFDDKAYASREMPFADFARIVAENSSSYFRQRTSSMINFFTNSGAYSLAVRHLNYFETNKDEHYWQHLRARSGVYESFIEVLRNGPGFTALILGSTLAWCFIVLSAVAGLSAFLKDKNINSFAKALLLSLIGYQVVIVVLFSVGARWQHRSLVDFIIILLAVYGLKAFQQYLNAKKLSAVY